MTSKELTKLRATLLGDPDNDPVFDGVVRYADSLINDFSGTQNTLETDGEFPTTILQATSFVAVITEDQSRYIPRAIDFLLITAAVSTSVEYYKGTIYRLMGMGISYDWLYEYLSESQKNIVINAIVSHINSLTSFLDNPNYTGGHSKYANLGMLVAFVSVNDEHSSIPPLLDKAYNVWVNGFNKVMEYTGVGGGHYMGWAYGSSYTDMESVYVWYAATGELWLENFLHDLGFWYIYGIDSRGKIPWFGDAVSMTVGANTIVYSVVGSAAITHNPYSEAFYRKYLDPSVGIAWTAFQVHRCIFSLYETDPKPFDELPLSRAFIGSGFYIIKNTMDLDKDSVRLVFKSTSFGSTNHHHYDQNSFTLNYKGPLLCDSGQYDLYGTDHWYNYYIRTIAHNTLVVYLPGEDFDIWGYRSNDGGQWPHIPLPKTLEDLKTVNKLDGIEIHSQLSSVSWVKGNATSSYRSEKMKKYVRDILFAYKIHGRELPVFIVVDTVHLSQQLTPRILWHLTENNPPEISGNDYALISNSNGGYGRLEFLKPKQKTVNTVTGDDYVDGVHYPPTQTENSDTLTWGRIEVSPDTPILETTFVTLFSVGDEKLTESKLKLAELVENENYVGAIVLNSLFIVITGDPKNVNEIIIDENIGKEAENGTLYDIFIAGIKPNSKVSVQFHTHEYILESNNEGLASLSSKSEDKVVKIIVGSLIGVVVTIIIVIVVIVIIACICSAISQKKKIVYSELENPMPAIKSGQEEFQSKQDITCDSDI